MQRGIDSFFKRITPAKKSEEIDSPAPKKRKALVISSDEDEIAESPQVSSSRASKKSRSTINKTPEKRSNGVKKPQLSKLNRVDPNTLFGASPLRVEARKPKSKEIIELEDENIDDSLVNMEVDVVLEKSEEISDTERKVKQAKETPTKELQVKSTPSPAKKNIKEIGKPTAKIEEKATKAQKETTTPKSEKHEKAVKAQKEEDTPKSEKKQKTKKAQKEVVTPKTEKEKPMKIPKKMDTPKSEKKDKTIKVQKEHSDLNSSVLSDEERFERKRVAAVLYQKFKNRSSCINPGSKEVPEGKPNCLAGLTFLVTGVLESLERDEANSIIKEYGGKVMSTVGKRLNYLIAGEDSGPKKLVQAEEFGVTVLTVDGFFDLIREKSGGKVKKAEKRDKVDKEAESPRVKKVLKEVEIKKEESESPPAKKARSDVDTVKKEFNNNNRKIKQEEVRSDTKITSEANVVVKTELNEENMAWVDKYKPTSTKEIVGQMGAASNVAKLTNWLSKWYINHDGKKKLQKPNPWAKNDDGSFYKAALLSGPPGIGKTTTATLVCKELGFDIVEFNASDTRSKRLLKEEVSELLSNKSLYGYFHGNAQAVSKKHVLLMDEVDGMAGNEDRGGIQELIGLIKESSIPIICMCNDRNHQKMRSLVNYCYDLRFNRPRLDQIKGRIMTICFREKLKIDPKKLDEIIAATNNDIRQTINFVYMLSAGKELPQKPDTEKKMEKTAQKDLKIGPWEVVRKVFSADEHKNMSFYDKCDLFFHDYSMAPLFVQQNYLQVTPVGPKSDVLRKVALTADALSLSDLVDKRIRSSAAWSLLPTQAIFSSVMPGEYMCGHFTGQINFPGWLGKNSRTNKRSRLAQEVHDHTRIRTSGSRLSVRMEYAPFLLSKIVRPLKEHGMEGVAEALDVMKEYHLLREDLDSLIELSTWPGKKSLMDAVDGRVKAALTRTYNKEVLAYTYSATANIKKKKAEADDDDLALGVEEGEEDGGAAVESDEEKDDNVENDALIKAKKKPAASASTSKAANSKGKASATTKKSTSKAATTSKGKK